MTQQNSKGKRSNYQDGYLYARNGGWHVRYREQVRQTDNSVATVQRSEKIASVNEYRRKSEVIPLKIEFMAKLNRLGYNVESGVKLVDFVENVYFPAADKRLEASTVRGYREAWRCHLRDRVLSVRVRDFRTVHGEQLMQEIEREWGTKLAHATYRWIKSTMSAIFTHAKRVGVLDGINPMQGVSVPKGKKHGRKTYAYTLEDIELAIELLPEPAHTAVGVAAFAGLRLGEIRGLRWEDFDLSIFRVRRSIWGTVVKSTKTGEDEGVVPVIQPLRTMLENIREGRTSGYIFRNTTGSALDLDNLTARVIRPLLKLHGIEWKGWHAFRRGLATNLSQLGVPDTTIQAILRHENVSTTQRSYIKTARRDVAGAMKQLEERLAQRADVMPAMAN